MAHTKLETMTFEETLVELSSIVAELENGELALDGALKQFERGVYLTRQGQKILSEAQQRVEILLANDDNASLSTFTNIDNDNE